jgi:FkbM family methyltransferase
VKKSKEYSSRYKRGLFVRENNSNNTIQYNLFLKGKKLPISIRTFTGDFDIFYEIFWRKVYQIPKKIAAKEYKTIVDLGANTGFTSVFYALHYPNAKIFALEAEEENYKILKQNTLFSDNITVKHGAIDVQDGSVYLSSPDLSYNFKVSSEPQKNVQKIQAYNMFSFMNLFKINHIDLLKIDIEGMEQSILSSNNEWLDKVDNIIIELHKPYEIEDLERDISPFGFRIIPPNSIKNLKMIFAVKKVI